MFENITRRNKMKITIFVFALALTVIQIAMVFAIILKPPQTLRVNCTVEIPDDLLRKAYENISQPDN